VETFQLSPKGSAHRRFRWQRNDRHIWDGLQHMDLQQKRKGSWADGALQNPALPDSIDNLVVADFNGDGVTDVGSFCGRGCWKTSTVNLSRG
jgi:hypothetical protein